MLTGRADTMLSIRAIRSQEDDTLRRGSLDGVTSPPSGSHSIPAHLFRLPCEVSFVFIAALHFTSLRGSFFTVKKLLHTTMAKARSSWRCHDE
ncbi:hypothetical protein CKAN_01599600 [Cinnamomum micranthum f. kanehirae]|uniref:Uncharacterized protein n=1 Tax=Cinnamomum micranthum f. kanehirae TaxID=337451 RepID=A0A443P8L8_9MAGN|nr:hypothetical protein CKAN_01599600 [Cinnamomum micranthum f. kanehirae]